MTSFRFAGFCSRLRKAVKDWNNDLVYIAKTSGLSSPLRVDVVLSTPEGLSVFPFEAHDQSCVDDLAPRIKEFLETGNFVGKVEENV